MLIEQVSILVRELRRRQGWVLVVLSALLTIVLVRWFGNAMNFTQFAVLPLMRTPDAYLNNWALYQAYENLFNNPLKLGHSDIFYGVPASFAYTIAPYGVALQTLPVYLATGRNVILTANIYSLLTFVLTAWVMFSLVRDLFDVTWWGGLLAAWAVAFSQFQVNHMEHFETLSLHLLIGVIWLAHRLLDAPSIRRGVLLGIVFALNLASNAYFGVFGLVALIVIGLYGLIVQRRSISRAHVVGLAAAALCGILLSLPFVLFRLPASGVLAGEDLSEVINRSADLDLWAKPSGEFWSRIGASLGSRRTLWIGGIVLVLSIVGGIAKFRSSDQHGFFSSRQLVVLYLIMGLIGFILSFGPSLVLGTDGPQIPMPFSWIDHIVGFSSIRAPRRFGLLTHIALGVLAAAGLTTIQRRFPDPIRSSALGVFALLLLGLDIVPIENYGLMTQKPQTVNTAIFEKLAEEPAGTMVIMHYPTNKSAITLGFAYQPMHHQPMINGAGSFFPEGYEILAEQYSDSAPPDFTDVLLQFAIDHGATHVVVNYDFLSDEEIVDYLRHRQAPESLWQEFDFIGRFGSADLYAIPDNLR